MKGYTIQSLKNGLEFAKAHPNRIISISADLNNGWRKKIKASEWRTWFRKCLQSKINRNMPNYGRKDNLEWFAKMWILSRDLRANKRFYENDIPKEYRQRLSHRISVYDPCDYCESGNCSFCTISLLRSEK